MPLQWSTTGVCHDLLRFPLTSDPARRAKASPDLGPLLHLMNPNHVLCRSPHNQARRTIYIIPN
jgi:hypothetical protein